MRGGCSPLASNCACAFQSWGLPLPSSLVMPVRKRGPFRLGSTRGRLEHVQKTEIWRGLFPEGSKH